MHTCYRYYLFPMVGMVTNLFDLVIHANVCKKKHASMLHIVITKIRNYFLVKYSNLKTFYLDYLRN